MSANCRMYYMTENQRQYYLMLLAAGREQQATDYRDQCDAYWEAHPDEWEKAKPQPIKADKE